MIKRFALIGTFTLVIAAAALPAYAQTHVSIGIGTPFYPPVGVVSAAPYPGYVWRPAHHVWTAFGYQLIPGAWVPAPYYAPRGLSFGLGFNVGHGYHVGRGYYGGRGYYAGRGNYGGHGYHGRHEGHHGRH